ncbi:TPA: Nif3-like dinuclear metal center protein, partial [Legionella pneumophila subsp. pneumophila]|nr:Nif3-like dinuclear metal center protein [Legionella pneumophila subsp. pneumophila]
ANLLLIESHEMHKVNNTANLLWSGKLSKAMNSEQFSSFLEHKLGRYPVHIAGNEKMIHSIAWCTGAAQDFIEEAYQLGVDAYLSGEVSERTFYQAMELGIQYFSCGHHATERFGIQSLGVYLANYFDLEHWFIDSPNPI